MTAADDREATGATRASPRLRPPDAALATAVLVGVALLGLALVSYARSDQPERGAGLVMPAVAGLPTGTVSPSRLYPPDDPWRAYLADEATCPGGERTDLPLPQQTAIMVCLVNSARIRRGLAPVVPVPILSRSALATANRIVHCRAFRHDACGAPADLDARAYGYSGPLGENLYAAGGDFGAPRAALDGWLNSPGHRENLFRPEWRSLGIAVEALPTFGPYREARLWVGQFAVG